MFKKCKIALAVLIILMSMGPFPGVSEFLGVNGVIAASGTGVHVPIPVTIGAVHGVRNVSVVVRDQANNVTEREIQMSTTPD